MSAPVGNAASDRFTEPESVTHPKGLFPFVTDKVIGRVALPRCVHVLFTHSLCPLALASTPTFICRFPEKNNFLSASPLPFYFLLVIAWVFFLTLMSP